MIINILQDAASAERSKTSVSKRPYLTWRQKCMFSVLGVGITIIIAVGTVIYFVVNKESEKGLFAYFTNNKQNVKFKAIC